MRSTQQAIGQISNNQTIDEAKSTINYHNTINNQLRAAGPAGINITEKPIFGPSNFFSFIPSLSA